MDKSVFKNERDNRNILKLRRILDELPPFCAEFFRGIDSISSTLTRLNYAYDLRTFFNFLLKEIPEFSDKTISTFTFADLNRVTQTHIEMFIDYLNYYVKDEKEFENHEQSKARKLSTLRSMFKYFFKKGRIDTNVASLVDMPKRHEKSIIRLEVDEVARLLDAVESGTKLSKNQQKYHKFTCKRDFAIVTLFLGTGIRISECVGLNVTDIDFNTRSFRVIRKGGNESTLYFGDEVNNALISYLEVRKSITPLEGHENALFLSIQRKRISIRAVENLVKKYATLVTPLKKISPHKQRSTLGTNLYRETGDIYLVADVLDHKDVNTT
ncbi:MAG TPA: tyrosine-type recombinase/integrase, partial [Clostridia bacterium]|nr:tyrosine-type recombinase/integrase [Clostridia bacterium]